MQYQFIKNHQGCYSVEELCECFGLSRSGYYEWRDRESSEREREDARLKSSIQAVHKKARGRYGHRPIYHHLKESGEACGRDRTLRLMKQMGIQGKQKRRYKPQCTDSKHTFGYAPNLLRNAPAPRRPDQVWVADTTYLRIEGGWSYLATVMDLCSRRIIGWSVSKNNDTALVSKALQAAVLTRGGQVPRGLIHHSDRGSTYASDDYTRLLRRHGITASMSAKGNCYDNAAQESFYGRYKTSSDLGDEPFADEQAARRHAFEYIELFYNRYRKHSSLCYETPAAYEENFYPPWGVMPEQALRLENPTTQPYNPTN